MNFPGAGLAFPAGGLSSNVCRGPAWAAGILSWILRTLPLLTPKPVFQQELRTPQVSTQPLQPSRSSLQRGLLGEADHHPIRRLYAGGPSSSGHPLTVGPYA